MTPVESTDAQMSKPVTKGETRVLSTAKNLGCKGAELSPRGDRDTGTLSPRPHRTLVEDQGGGVDDDPRVQHLWGFGGAEGGSGPAPHPAPVPAVPAGPGPRRAGAAPAQRAGAGQTLGFPFQTGSPRGCARSEPRKTRARERGGSGGQKHRQHGCDPASPCPPRTPRVSPPNPPEGRTVAAMYCTVPQSRTRLLKRRSRYWGQGRGRCQGRPPGPKPRGGMRPPAPTS